MSRRKQSKPHHIFSDDDDPADMKKKTVISQGSGSQEGEKTTSATLPEPQLPNGETDKCDPATSRPSKPDLPASTNTPRTTRSNAHKSAEKSGEPDSTPSASKHLGKPDTSRDSPVVGENSNLNDVDQMKMPDTAESETKLTKRLVDNENLFSSASDMTSPENVRLGREQTCRYCGVVMKSPADLARHLKKHTGEKPYICEICKKSFKVKRSLQYHQYMSHGIEHKDGNICEKLSEARKRKVESERQKEEDQETRKHVKTDDDAENSSGEVPETLTSSTIEDMDTASPENEIQEEKNSTEVHDENKIALEDNADQEKAEKEDLGDKVNESIKMDASDEDDDDDSKSLSSASALTKVAVSEEDVEDAAPSAKNVTERGCESPFQSEASYSDEQMKPTASTSISKACPYCGKMCLKPSDLKRHLMVHTGERPFKCQICGKGFKAKGSMQYHMKAHHDLDIELSQGLEERYLRLKANQEQKKLSRIQQRDQAQVDETGPDNSNLGEVKQECSEMGELDDNSIEPSSHESSPELDTESISRLSLSARLGGASPGKRTSKTQKILKSLEKIEQPSIKSILDSLIDDISLSEDEDMEDSASIDTLGSSEDPVIEYPGPFPGGKQTIRIRNETVIVTRLEGLNEANQVEVSLYKCHLCSKVFNYLSKLQCHLSVHFERHLTTFQCSVCGAHFKFRVQLQHHYKLHAMSVHRDRSGFASKLASGSQSDSTGHKAAKTGNTDDDGALDVASNSGELDATAMGQDEVEDGKVKNDCFSSDQKRGVDGSHKSSRFQVKEEKLGPDRLGKLASLEGRVLSIPRGQKLPHRKSNGLFMCRFCNKGFFRLFSLQRHERVHTGFKPCYCKECGKGFSEPRNLRQHIIRFHSDGSLLHLVRRVRKKGGFTYSKSMQKLAPVVGGSENEDSSMDTSQSMTAMFQGSEVSKSKLAQSEEMLGDMDSDYGNAEGTSVGQLAKEIREKECLSDDVLVIIPSDAPIDPKEGSREAPASNVSGSTLWSDDVSDSDSTHSNEITAAPVKSLMKSLKQHVKSKRKPVTPVRLGSQGEEMTQAQVKTPALIKQEEVPTMTSSAERTPSLIPPSMAMSPVAGSTAVVDAGTMQIHANHDKPIVTSQHSPSVGNIPIPSVAVVPASGTAIMVTAPPVMTLGGAPGYVMPQSAISPTGPPGTYGLPLLANLGPMQSMPTLASKLSPTLTSQTLASKLSPEENNNTKVPLTSEMLSVGWHHHGNMSSVITNSSLSDPTNARSSSLSRTHSRLFVVRAPVKREEACKPIELPDGRTVYRCTYCGKDFGTFSDINRHMDFHEDIRPYKCQFCDYYARTNSQLKVHMMRHQGIRDFHCKLCNYKGVTQSDLNRHMKSQIHMLKAQNKCVRCGEGFVSPKTLEKHVPFCPGEKSMQQDQDTEQPDVSVG